MATIRIAPERADQLRAMAEHRGISMSAFLGELIQRAIDEGALPADRAPGLGMTFSSPRPGEVSIQFGDMTEPRVFSTNGAYIIADTVEVLIRSKTRGPVGVIYDEVPVEVRRVGPGIAFVVYSHNRRHQHVVTREVATALMNELLAVAARADAQD